MKEKLLSRKLWVALIGAITGIVLCFTGVVSEGVTTVITSVLGYLVAEGYIDAKAVNLVIDQVDEKFDETVEEIKKAE